MDYSRRVKNYAGYAEKIGVDALVINARMRGNDDGYLMPELEYGISRRDIILIFANGDAVYLTPYEECAKEAAGIGYVRCVRFEGTLAEALARQLAGHGARRVGFSPMEMPASLYMELEKTPDAELVPWDMEESMWARRIKDDGEIAVMTAGQRIAEAAWGEVIAAIRPGMTEKEIRSSLIAGMIRRGATSHSCGIVSSGVNTSNVHWQATDKPVQAGDLIMFDFGCVYQGYCTDMTRTIALVSATDEQRRVYDLVLEAQLAAIGLIAPGASCRAMHNAAVAVFAREGMEKYFTHGIGHNVGKIIHEYPYSDPESEDVFCAGDLTTVEPGLYLPERFGVRIEDMVWLSPAGRVNLTAAPKETLMVVG